MRTDPEGSVRNVLTELMTSEEQWLEKPENRRQVEKILAELLGQPVRLLLVAVTGQAARQTPEEIVAQDAMVQETLRVFKGTIVSRRRTRTSEQE